MVAYDQLSDRILGTTAHAAEVLPFKIFKNSFPEIDRMAFTDRYLSQNGRVAFCRRGSLSLSISGLRSSRVRELLMVNPTPAEQKSEIED